VPSLENLRRAIRELPHLYDNSDLAHPFRRVAEFEGGKAVELASPSPTWVPWTRTRFKRVR